MSGSVAIGAHASHLNSWGPPDIDSFSTADASAAGTDRGPADPISIIFDPVNLDFGRVCTSSIVWQSVRITNVSASTLVLLEPQTTCGCTVATLAQRIIEPGGSITAEVQLTLPSYPTTVRKRVRFRFGGELPARILDVTATVERLIAVRPERLLSDTVASTEITVESTDGHVFSVIGALPPVTSISVPTETAAEHRIWIDPILWNALGQPNRIALQLDGPWSEQIVLEIEPPVTHRRTKATHRIADSDAADQKPGARNGGPPQRDIRVLELGPIPNGGMVESSIVIGGNFDDDLAPHLVFESPQARCELAEVIKSPDSWTLKVRFRPKTARAADLRAPLFVEIGSARVICVVLASFSEK